MIDTNVRSVKRTDAGATVLTKATSTLRSLCDHCALQRHCEHRARIADAVRAAKLSAPVTTCRLYQYPIHFVDTRGLDVPGFNTMRMGTAWAGRLESGDLVGLLNGDKQLVASTQVKTITTAPLTVAGLLPYAHRNHMLIGQGMAPEQAAEKLLKILRNNYGKLVFERSTQVTVIGF